MIGSAAALIFGVVLFVTPESMLAGFGILMSISTHKQLVSS